MDIATLKAFIIVAQQQSFSKASELLHLTQPAVSKRVASLEQELEVSLFNRINRQVSLTDAGKQLLPKAQELVNQAVDMQRYVDNMHERVSGILPIAISHHIALYRMPPILKRFNQLYDSVKLDIRFEDSEQALDLVEQGDIELAIITLPSTLMSNLRMDIVWQDPLCIVVGREHQLVKSTKVSLQQLSKYPCVLTTADTETYQIIWREFNQENVNLNVQMSTNNLQSLKMLVVAGIGWSLLPQTMLDEDLVVLGYKRTLIRKLGIVTHSKRSLSNAALAMNKLVNQFD